MSGKALCGYCGKQAWRAFVPVKTYDIYKLNANGKTGGHDYAVELPIIEDWNNVVYLCKDCQFKPDEG